MKIEKLKWKIELFCRTDCAVVEGSSYIKSVAEEIDFPCI